MMTALMRRLVLGDLDLTDYPFSVEFGGDLGSPTNVYDTLVSMLAEGDLVGLTRVSAPPEVFSDLPGLVLGEFPPRVRDGLPALV